ncbi:MAG: hypothetical protein AAF629_10210 [Chloroflexota bacterium]
MKHKRLFFHLMIVCLLFVSAWPAQAQGNAYPLENCEDMAFSTEEDFMMSEGEPYDGNPYISDGDLLSTSGLLCARNADLIAVFFPNGVVADLGLDAVDILNVSDRVVAFSTELDDPFQTFSAGDLLMTNGAIIPNKALVSPFGIRHDIGLDAVHFLGEQEAIVSFASFAVQLAPDDWENGRLQEELSSFGIDIWFSVEGTHQTGQNPILDGDVLSAATGTVVAPNNILIHGNAPGGIPNRGIDFGVDALLAPRILQTETQRRIHFSTEILHRGEAFNFNDGDILLYADDTIVFDHYSLIQAWQPHADFLGLDAFSGPMESEPPTDPNLQTMCGDTKLITDFDGGRVAIGGPGTGLYGNLPERPCGNYVPFDGFLPDTNVQSFRVAYRAVGDPVPPVGQPGNGVQTHWLIKGWNYDIFNPGCEFNNTLETDADGWMNANAYLAAKNGNAPYFCANSGLRLAVWDTDNKMGFGPADKDGHYVVWLEWRDSANVLHREPFDHHIQLDNTLPEIAAYPDGLQVRLQDGTTVVPACGEAPGGESLFQVWAQFSDDYYWNTRLRVRGGLPPTSVNYGPHNYYDIDDGTPGIKNTDDTGTNPDGTLVHLRNIDMTDFGDAFQDCCYLLEMWVRDAAIRHSFNKVVANDNSGSSAYQANAFTTFAAGP